MDFQEVISTRRSKRSFTDRQVPEDVLNQILREACMTPSSGNLQPYEFLIIRDNNSKRLLSQAAYGQEFIAQAPVNIIVLTNTKRSAEKYKARGSKFYALVDAAMAANTILLSATNKQLSCCPVGAFNEYTISTLFDLPWYIDPICIISLGYSNEKPLELTKLNKDQLTHYECYNL